MTLLGDSSGGEPLELNRQINRLCDDYERQLASGETPNLEALLAQISPEGRRPLLAEIIAITSEHESEAGRGDPVASVISRYPSLADEIRSAAESLSGGEETAFYEPPQHAAAGSPQLTPRRKRSRGLHIRCPHCSNHVELVGDTPLDLIDCSTCGSSFSLVDRSKETRMAQALQKIDRFELVARLGVGGFGTVWKARDTDLDRAVAVKIPRHGQLSPEEMEQFFREARSVAQLRHPNIVPVHEVGREGDAVFIVSDLIRGVSLADMLTGKSFTPREAAELLIAVADALEHAHQRGVIHRDLKPSNIMIDDDGTPFLMDFGLAKREADEVTMTTDGQIIGTPAYMSPEQADGRSAWADRRTDIYSLGVILFELLTGELPFRGNAQMQVHTRLKEDAPNARSLNRHLPLDLATVTAKCLEREPGRRYQTATDVADELRRYLNKEPVHARPLSPIGRVARWVERRPLHATIVALVATLAVGGPAAAVLIERQRAAAQSLADRNQNLIDQRLAEQSDSRGQELELQQRLDLWEGRSNPWELWPPKAELPPRRQLSASILASRGAVLSPSSGSLDEEPPLQRAMRLLALATLHESVDQDRSAEQTLRQAAEVLQAVRDTQSDATRVTATLADVYTRISFLVADREEARQWLQRASDLLAPAGDTDALATSKGADYFESELRLAASAGFEGASEHLENAQATQEWLSEQWPRSVEALYAVTSRLAGREPLLLDAPTEAAKEER